MPLSRLIIALAVVVGVPSILVGYLALVEWLLRLLPPLRRRQVRPWFWIGPALVLVGFGRHGLVSAFACCGGQHAPGNV